MIGSTLAQRYRIDGQLGAGGMGIVYKAYDTRLLRDVALKVIAAHLLEQADAKERFVREAQALAGLTHPNIITVYDLVEDTESGHICIVMELLEGHSLRSLMPQESRPNFYDLAIQMCKALEAAHSKGILHRDIKPENIFVCSDGIIKLMDFGLARILSYSATGSIMGTAGYMSPEQIQGRYQDARSDLYALGLVFYEYLVGEPPLKADNPASLMMLHLTQDPISPHERSSDIPETLSFIVMRLLKKDPVQRYPSAKAVRSAIEDMLLRIEIAARQVAAGSAEQAQPSHTANFEGEPARISGQAPVRNTPGFPIETPKKIVLLYKRNLQPDEKALLFLEERLRARGHDVYVDRHLKIGVEWANSVELRIREADVVIAIVSPKSLQSEMLEFEAETAHDQYSQTGKPIILPVRIGSFEEIEGPIGAIINSLNHFIWHDEGDNQRLATELLSAINEPYRNLAEEVKLEPVGGAVPPDSPFYIARATDHEFLNALANRETILLVKGARQMGKTSLLAQGSQFARGKGWRCGLTDFQKLNASQLAQEELFYKLLAATLARQLKFKYDFENEWIDIFGANLNMENFLRELLDSAEEPLVWFMDEVDKLFTAPYASDFFGLVRSWHNSRSTEPGGPWDKLTVVISYATEAHLFIQDVNQSPFNVGRRLELKPFTLQQVADLNGRYGTPLRSYQEVEAVYALIGGQPFLVRRALDALATGRVNFASLFDEADRDEGPFGDHLKRILVSVSRLPSVTAYVKSLLSGAPSNDADAFYRLLAAGVIEQNLAGDVRFRCKLYQRYLQNHL